MLPTHEVPCPACHRPLYTAVSLEDGVDAGAIESPKVEHDSSGDYMTCPSCGARVPMARMRIGNAEAWRPARR